MNNLIILGSIILTIAIYRLSLKVGRRYPSPFTTPVFFSTTIIIVLLVFTGVTYEQYEPAKEIMSYLLGPATVALAIPIYRQRKILLRYSLIGGIGLVLGSITTILSIIVIAHVFQLDKAVIASLSVKSATVPIAVEITKVINGDPSLTAVFVVATGIVGGMLGPWFLNKTRIKDPISRGLSMGTIAHGQGTAEISREGQLQGAIAGIAMSLSAIFISIFVPMLFL